MTTLCFRPRRAKGQNAAGPGLQLDWPGITSTGNSWSGQPINWTPNHLSRRGLTGVSLARARPGSEPGRAPLPSRSDEPVKPPAGRGRTGAEKYSGPPPQAKGAARAGSGPIRNLKFSRYNCLENFQVFNCAIKTFKLCFSGRGRAGPKVKMHCDSAEPKT